MSATITVKSNDEDKPSFLFSVEAVQSVLARILLVAGGAAGRMGASLTGNGGGGSGGQPRDIADVILDLTKTYEFVIGNGGLGTRLGEGGSDGENSTFGEQSQAPLYTALGGARGGGQGPYSPPNSGTYGGGAGWLAGSHLGANGTIANKGGDSQPGAPHRGGGGGGAGGDGVDGSITGDGGPAVFIDFDGTSRPFGAGGGGGADSAAGVGGSGVGGTGAKEAPPTLATPGVDNTGSGGGGGGSEGGGNPNTLAGANGGSGKGGVRYTGSPKFTGGIVTTVGGDTVHTFLASGLLIPI